MRSTLLILLSYLAISCTVKPPDVFVFESLDQHLSRDQITQHLLLMPSPACIKAISEVECGHGTSIVSGTEVYIGEESTHLFNGKKWSELKSESIYVPAVESYAPISEYIINSCKKMNCSNDVTRFKVKIDKLKNVNSVKVSDP